MANKIIEVKNLQKKFGKTNAVNGVTFGVEKGDIIALLGPNGAGKTTTLEMIEGLLKPSGGSISVLGFNPVTHPDEVKRRVGIQLQSSSYYDHLNLAELIDLFASFYNKKAPVDKLLNMVGLADKKKSYVKQLSGGQQQRFSIVATLVNDPEIVFLDEPTTGLDPQARRNIWDIIKKIRKDGKTIILTTHYMEEAEVLADKVYIVDHGKIVSSGTPKELIKKLPNPFRIELTTNKIINEKKINAIAGVVSVREDVDGDSSDVKNNNYRYFIATKEINRSLLKIIDVLKKDKIGFEDIAVVPSNLEDVFLTLTGKELRD